MKRSNFIALLLGSCLAASAETEERITKQFLVQPGGRLVIEVGFGSIDVQTNATGEALIDVVRKVTRSTKEDEESFLADQPVTITAEGNIVTIQSPAQRRNIVAQGRNRTEGKYTITVPARFNAQVKTGGGAVAMSDLTGDFAINTGGGGLKLIRLHGPLNAGTGGGPINMAECTGDQRVKTGGGGIEVAGGSGSFDGATAGGPVSIRDFRGPVQTKSSGGGITVENVAGKLEGKTSGGSIAARFDQPPSNEVHLVTSGGGVTLRVPENAAFDLDASTVGGSVRSDLAISQEGKPSRTRLKGSVNGGGQAVVLRSGGGSIEVLKQ